MPVINTGCWSDTMKQDDYTCPLSIALVWLYSLLTGYITCHLLDAFIQSDVHTQYCGQLIPTRAIWGEVSCPGTQWHADCSGVWTWPPDPNTDTQPTAPHVYYINYKLIGYAKHNEGLTLIIMKHFETVTFCGPFGSPYFRLPPTTASRHQQPKTLSEAYWIFVASRESKQVG